MIASLESSPSTSNVHIRDWEETGKKQPGSPDGKQLRTLKVSLASPNKIARLVREDNKLLSELLLRL